MATRSLGSNLGIPAGAWRWAALGFVFLALGAAGLAVATPNAAGWAGVMLLAAIGAVASLFLFAVWPKEKLAVADARRVAEAAARANIAWAITTSDGAVVDCNEVYRKMSGAKDGEAAPPPELALAGEPSAAVLYRLTRGAAEGVQREESFAVAPGIELVAAVRPLTNGQTAWWFTPRLSTPSANIHPIEKVAAPVAAAAPAAPVPVAPPGIGDVFRDAPVGVAFASGDGMIVDANPEFVQFFGIGGPLIGRPFAELIDAGDRTRVGEMIAAAASGARNASSVELKAAGADEKMAELFVSPISGGRAILYLVDVSEQKALETKFAQSQKMQAVGQLAGGVAHDFNNLLTVIIGNSEFLLMRHQAGDPSFKEINEIHQNALRAANLVRQLLAFSRKQTLQPRVLALREAIGELGQLLRRLVGDTIDVKMEYGADLWPVHADEAQLSNAIINLVVNARDAMPRGGTVTIRSANESVVSAAAFGTAVMPAGDYVRIEVADTGTGIAPEHLGKIFDPFFTTKPVGQGTGLGLATVYGIVKQTGGFIDVKSEIGKGTTFQIYLPRHRADENAPAAAEAAQAGPRDVTGQDTIMLVEDEEAVRSFAARALRMRGYNVIEASGGEEALERIKRETATIHLLITDVVMPNMDGPTLVRNVKRIKPDMAVIFMSGYAEEAFRRNDENAADLHFLPKPFGLKQLAAKVKEVLSGAPVPKRVVGE
ncbi:MAG: response regulator [Alphaproteobacteria bacterium]|nr:response regulator [Alphaproteobacteria bacterium]MBL7098169.1 response regulator [Alphaproteobacteria bacterium]